MTARNLSGKSTVTVSDGVPSAQPRDPVAPAPCCLVQIHVAVAMDPLRNCGRCRRPGTKIFACPGLAETDAGLDWQAWAVGAGDFRRRSTLWQRCSSSRDRCSRLGLARSSAWFLAPFACPSAPPWAPRRRFSWAATWRGMPSRGKIERNEKFAAIDRAVADEGWKIVLLTRLSPVFPFTLLNYAFGLTRVRLSHYVLASWIGMIPGHGDVCLSRLAGQCRSRTSPAHGGRVDLVRSRPAGHCGGDGIHYASGAGKRWPQKIGAIRRAKPQERL